MGLKNRRRAAQRLVAPGSDLDRLQLEFTLHEYDKVKDELLAALDAQHTTMTYSFTAAAAIFTGLLTIWDDYALRLSVLALSPLLLEFLWFVWLGELIRMARAARFLWEREKELNKFFRTHRPVSGGASPLRADALAWEGWVRGSNEWQKVLHLGPSYALLTCALFGMGVVSDAIALAFTFFGPSAPPWSRVLVILSVVITCGLGTLGATSIMRNPVLVRGLGEISSRR